MMAARKDWIIVPAKAFDQAKVRLSSLLSVSERAELARTMLGDVLVAASSLGNQCEIGVVTGSSDVAEYVGRFGAIPIDDRGARSTNDAMKAGLHEIALRGSGAVVAISGDIPGVLAADLSAMLAAARRQRVSVAPALADGGTNGLACDFAGRLSPCFGPDSFNLHIQAASEIGIRPEVIRNVRLGLDIDEPLDVVEFLATKTQTETDSYLRAIEAGSRLDRLIGTARRETASRGSPRNYWKSTQSGRSAAGI